MWNSQLKKPKCKVISFLFFVSGDLCNAVFLCLIFAIEILDVKEKRDRNNVKMVSEKDKTLKLEIFSRK
jgi:hypothetical protein